MAENKREALGFFKASTMAVAFAPDRQTMFVGYSTHFYEWICLACDANGAPSASIGTTRCSRFALCARQ